MLLVRLYDNKGNHISVPLELRGHISYCADETFTISGKADIIDPDTGSVSESCELEFLNRHAPFTLMKGEIIGVDIRIRGMTG